jgi:hypothetical protein
MNAAATHQALVNIFGAEPEQIVMTSRDHLCITANFRELCLAVGGTWSKLVEDLDAQLLERKTWKDPGEDVRNREEKKPQSVVVALDVGASEFGDKA